MRRIRRMFGRLVLVLDESAFVPHWFPLDVDARSRKVRGRWRTVALYPPGTTLTQEGADALRSKT